jgi:hypothetical protein
MNGITVTMVVRDEGSIVLMRGVEHETDRIVTFAVEHRPAQDIVDALGRGEDVEVYDVEDWQVMSSHAPASTG